MATPATTPLRSRAGANGHVAAAGVSARSASATKAGDGAGARRFATMTGRATSVSSATKAARPATATASGGGASAMPATAAASVMQTFVRIKPSTLNGFEPGGMGSYAAGPTSATVTMLTDAGMSKVAAAGSGAGGASSTPAFAVKEYTVRGVLGPTSRQAEVYDATLAAIVPRLFEGHNACCALYGMTGSGKTHTFSGPVGASATDFGLMQRAFHDIFARCAVLAAGEADENSAGGGGGGQRATVKVDFIEVYNDNVYDLLAFADAVADAPTNHKGARDRFLEAKYADCRRSLRDSGSGVAIPDTKLVTVTSADEAIATLLPALAARTSASTEMNEHSSRSHALLRVHLAVEDGRAGKVRTALLSLVDLAGSERQKNTAAEGVALAQAGAINKSLSALTDCLKRMVDVQKVRHAGAGMVVPWRASTLTHVLRPCLDGGAHVAFIITLNPNPAHWAEALASLDFAARTGQIAVRPIANVSAMGGGGGGGTAASLRSLASAGSGMDSTTLSSMTARIASLEMQLATAQRHLQLLDDGPGDGGVAKAMLFDGAAGSTAVGSPIRGGASAAPPISLASPDVKRTARDMRLAVKALFTLRPLVAEMVEGTVAVGDGDSSPAISPAKAALQAEVAALQQTLRGAREEAGRLRAEAAAARGEIVGMHAALEAAQQEVDRLRVLDLVALTRDADGDAAHRSAALPAAVAGFKRGRAAFEQAAAPPAASLDGEVSAAEPAINGRRLRRRLSEEHWEVRGDDEDAAVAVGPDMDLDETEGAGVVPAVAAARQPAFDAAARAVLHAAAVTTQRTLHRVLSEGAFVDGAATLDAMHAAMRESQRASAAAVAERDRLEAQLREAMARSVAAEAELAMVRSQTTAAARGQAPLVPPLAFTFQCPPGFDLPAAAAATTTAMVAAADAAEGGEAEDAEDAIVTFKGSRGHRAGDDDDDADSIGDAATPPRSSLDSGTWTARSDGGLTARSSASTATAALPGLAAGQRRERRLVAGAGGAPTAVAAPAAAAAPVLPLRPSTLPAAPWLANRAPVDPFYRPKPAPAPSTAEEDAPTAAATVADESMAPADNDAAMEAAVDEAGAPAETVGSGIESGAVRGDEAAAAGDEPAHDESAAPPSSEVETSSAAAVAPAAAAAPKSAVKPRRALRALIAPAGPAAAAAAENALGTAGAAIAKSAGVHWGGAGKGAAAAISSVRMAGQADGI